MAKGRLISPVLMWLFVIAGIMVIINIAPAASFFSRNTFTSALLFLALIYWAYFFFGAIWLNRNAARSVGKTPRIITTGVYGLVRHPIYGADIILSLALFLFFPDIRVGISVVWLTLTLIGWMMLEEWGLEKRFGYAYREYKKRVPMFLPFWNKRKK